MELGVVGLALLILILATAAVGAIRARRQRFVAAGLGAFVAWSAASAFDWHWEMVGVTIVGPALRLRRALRVRAQARDEPSRRDASRPGRDHERSQRVRGVEPRRQPGALRGSRGARAQGVERGTSSRPSGTSAPALVVRAGRSCSVTRPRAWVIAKRRCARIAMPLQPIRASWVAWLRLAQVARGAERARRVRSSARLNPLEEGLPGE